MAEITGFKSKLKGYFITGLLVLVPIILTIYVLKIIIALGERFCPVRLPVPDLGIIMTLAIILATGFVAQTTTPNSTSGFYLLVPECDIITIDMSVEEAFKVIISGGLCYPPSDRIRT